MKVTAWIGTVASVLGSFIVASQMFLVGYCFFIVGSVSWLLVGLDRRDSALISLNFCFLTANLIGLYNSGI
jgi:hypothetical protein